MSDTTDLSLPEEPLALRRRTRALIEEDAERGRAVVDAGSWIADPLWERWGPALEPAGKSAAGGSIRSRGAGTSNSHPTNTIV